VKTSARKQSEVGHRQTPSHQHTHSPFLLVVITCRALSVKTSSVSAHNQTPMQIIESCHVTIVWHTTKCCLRAAAGNA
jgi:hypothetical protein